MADFHKDRDGDRGAASGNNKNFALSFMQGGGQNSALKWLTSNAVPVCIFLITGVKFEGVITSFDQYTICITDIKGHQQLIYKDKISTLTLRKHPGAKAPAAEN